MMPDRITAHVNRLPWGAIIVGVLVLAAVAAYLDNQSENRAQESQARDAQTAKSRIEGCERFNRLALNVARGATAQSDYLDKVLAAASVQEDVKRAARRAITLWAESANQVRIMLFQCEPLINDQREVLDENAVREAKGEL